MYGAFKVLNQYELLSGVTQKQPKHGIDKLRKINSFSTSSAHHHNPFFSQHFQDYDSFMTNLAQLKVTKAFTEINFVRKSA